MSPFGEALRAALESRPKRFVRDVPASDAAPTPAGVLIPVFERDGAPHLVFTRRTDTVRDHKGQISFPGGARDPQDGSLLDTALREAREEIGLEPSAVEILGELDDYVTVTNYLVTPFVGLVPDAYGWRPHAAEVAEVLEVPLQVLRDPARHEVRTLVWQGEPREVHYFDAGSCIVWGVTARILLQLLDAVDRMPSR